MRAFICCLLLAMTVQGQPDRKWTKYKYTDDKDTLRTYEPISEADDKFLERQEIQDKGAWTIWMDRDIPNPWGTGEFENPYRQRVEDAHRGVCHMWCLYPLAMEIRLSQNHANLNTSTLEEVLTCANTHPEVYNPITGFSCSNDEQKDGINYRIPEDIGCNYDQCKENGLGDKCQDCPDVAVRYFCLFEEFDCQLVAKRTLGHSRLGFEGMQDFTSNQKHRALKQEQKQTQKKALLEDKLLEKLLQILKNNHK